MPQMAQTAGSQDPILRLSPSVERLNTEVRLTATGVAHAVYKDHPRYPRQREAVEATRAGIDVGPVRTAAEWIDAVARQLDLEQLGLLPPHEQQLHGQLLIYGLARIDPPLHAVLSADRLLDDLRARIDPDAEELFAGVPYSELRSAREAGSEPKRTEPDESDESDEPYAPPQDVEQQTPEVELESPARSAPSPDEPAHLDGVFEFVPAEGSARDA